jgi:long-chain acyl-CoA synthetase
MRTLAAGLRWRARRHPDLPATWFEGRTRTYGEIDRRSTELAAGLIAKLGLQPGDHVCVLDKNSDDYWELFYALDKAGAIATPINWRLTPGEVRVIADDARPAVFVAGPDFVPIAQEAGYAPLTWEQLPRMPGAADPERDAENGVTWQLYTSGTTGLPKGAMLTNLNLTSMALPIVYEVPEMREGGRALVAMPLYHIGGCGWASAAASAGSCLVITREVVPQQLIQIIAEQRVETAFLVPAVLLFMSQIPGVEKADFSSLRNVLYGASPITPSVLEAAIATFKCRFTQVYGLTETTGAITALAFEEHQGDRLLSAGRAMFGAEVRVVDPEANAVGPGEVGEIAYRGAGVMAGYWNRPEATAEAIRDGWFFTGDAGTMDERGFVYIKDRIKDMIISGGENVYPIEVETVLAGHPDVADVAVFGVPDDRWGETVKAAVVRKPGSTLAEEELIEWSRDRLAGFKRPRSVDFIDAIPRNPSGKILKRELRAPYWQGAGRQVH